MAKPSLIHVKLNYNEAHESKKHLLSLELDLVKLQRAMKKFQSLRMLELKEKQKLRAKLSTAKIDLQKLKISLPHLELPKILSHKEIEDENIEKKAKKEIKEFGKIIETHYDDSLEQELRDIQERLKEMGKK